MITTARRDLLRETIRQALAELSKIPSKDLVDQRYEKFRRMGSFFSEGA